MPRNLTLSELMMVSGGADVYFELLNGWEVIGYSTEITAYETTTTTEYVGFDIIKTIERKPIYEIKPIYAPHVVTVITNKTY